MPLLQTRQLLGRLLTFVLPGVFEQHSGDESQQLITSNGGKTTASISKKLSYLVAK